MVTGSAFAAELLEHLPTAVIAADEAGRVTYANPAARDLMGWRAAVSGEDLFGQLGESAALRDVLHAIPERGEGRAHVTLRSAQGLPIEVGLTIHRHAATSPMAYVVLARDVSVRLRRERQAARSDQLSAVDGLMSGLAHQLRNPMAAIQVRMEDLVHDAARDPVLRHNAERVLDLLGRIDRILSTLQRIGDRPSRSVGLAPMDLIDSAIAELRGRVETWPVQVTVRPGLPRLRGDADQIVHCLVALIENALDASPAGAPVHVEVFAADALTSHELAAPTEPHSLLFRVRDLGSGIAERDLPHVFDPFFSTKASGTGLGLTLAQAFALRHGGEIRLRSTPGTGTVADLLLPGASQP